MIKRMIAGSMLALGIISAATPSVARGAESVEEMEAPHPGTLVLVYCLSCGTHHLVYI